MKNKCELKGYNNMSENNANTILREADKMIDREELKRRLPSKIMHQTLNLILKYLEEKGMIIDSHKGILWIYNPSPKLKKAIENAREI